MMNKLQGSYKANEYSVAFQNLMCKILTNIRKEESVKSSRVWKQQVSKVRNDQWNPSKVRLTRYNKTKINLCSSLNNSPQHNQQSDNVNNRASFVDQPTKQKTYFNIRCNKKIVQRAPTKEKTVSGKENDFSKNRTQHGYRTLEYLMNLYDIICEGYYFQHYYIEMYHEFTCEQMYKQQLKQLHYTSSQLITYNQHKKQFVIGQQGKLTIVGEEGTEYVELPPEWGLWVVEWLEADIYAVWAEWVEEGCYMHGVWVVQGGELLLGWKVAFEAGVYVVMDKCTIVYCRQTKKLTSLHLNSKHSAIRQQCSVPPSSPLQSQSPISPTSAISLHSQHSTVFPHQCSSKTFSYEHKKFVGKGEQPLREKFSFLLGVEEEGWHVCSLHEYPKQTELLLSKHQQYMLVLWWREENKVVKGRGKVQGKVMEMVDAGGCKLLVGEDEDSVKVWLLGGEQHQFRVLNSMSIEGVKYSKVLTHNDSISVITQPFTPSNELLPLPIIYRVTLIPKHILYCQMLQQLQIVQDSQLQSLLQQLHQILA